MSNITTTTKRRIRVDYQKNKTRPQVKKRTQVKAAPRREERKWKTKKKKRRMNWKMKSGESLLYASIDVVAHDNRWDSKLDTMIGGGGGIRMDQYQVSLDTRIMWHECRRCKECAARTLIMFSDSKWSEGSFDFTMIFYFYFYFYVNTFSDRNTGPKDSFSNFLDLKPARGGTFKGSFFQNLNSFRINSRQLETLLEIPSKNGKKVRYKRDFHFSDFSS
jgi:hypothetical protein